MLDFLFGAIIDWLPPKALIVLGIALLYVLVIGGLIYFLFLS